MIFAIHGKHSRKSPEDFKTVFAPKGRFLVKGITFFGTPFKGSMLANWVGDPLAKVLHRNRSFISPLKKKDAPIEAMLREFDTLRLRPQTSISLLIFYEKKPLKKFFFQSIVNTPYRSCTGKIWSIRWRTGNRPWDTLKMGLSKGSR